MREIKFKFLKFDEVAFKITRADFESYEKEILKQIKECKKFWIKLNSLPQRQNSDVILPISIKQNVEAFINQKRLKECFLGQDSAGHKPKPDPIKAIGSGINTFHGRRPRDGGYRGTVNQVSDPDSISNSSD